MALKLAAALCDNGARDLPWLARRLRTQPTLAILKLAGGKRRDDSVVGHGRRGRGRMGL